MNMFMRGFRTQLITSSILKNVLFKITKIHYDKAKVILILCSVEYPEMALMLIQFQTNMTQENISVHVFLQVHN